jgi:hypothetical protein
MKIQVINTFTHSFKDVRSHMLNWFRVGYAPLLIWAIGALVMGISYWSLGHSLDFHEALTGQLKSLDQVSPEDRSLITLAHGIYYITTFIYTFAIQINGYRYGVLHENGTHWWTLHLNWRFLKLVLYSLLVGILMVLYGGITGGLVWSLHYAYANLGLDIALGTLFGIFGFYLLFRVALYTLLISIDKVKPLRTSWHLLKGNVLRIISLYLLLVITAVAILAIGAALLALFGLALGLINASLGVVSILLTYLLSVFIFNFILWALMAKANSIVYLTLTEGKAL